MSLAYSEYNDKSKQYYNNNNPPEEDKKSGIAKKDENGKWYREAPATDWGLTVNGGENNWEIQASDNTSEAVVIKLDGLAYGFTVNFGAFFAGKEENSDKVYGTGYDKESEKALIAFYKGDKLVYSHVAEGHSSGEFVYNSGEVILGGFDRVVISAVHNDDNSDFTIQGFDFVTKRDDPIIVNGGTVTAESGADGFAEEYKESNVKFDLESMVQEDSLNDEGTSGTIAVFINGELKDVTLELREGSSGESILTGTIEGTNKQLFTATLDQEGHWTMEQYEHFRVSSGEEVSNQFELAFKTEDSDGDVANSIVPVPLELTQQLQDSAGNLIDNGNDSIVISGGNGVAGTVVAGDTGGMTEDQQIDTNYNICFILDMSNSMHDNIGKNRTRLDVAVDSIQNFVRGIENNNEFTAGSIKISVIAFAENAEIPIEITITKNSSGEFSYIFNGESGNLYGSYDINDISNMIENSINKIDKDWSNSSYWSNPENITTDYKPAFNKAADWYYSLGDDVKNATNNITYFLTDGRPAGAGTDNAYLDDYERAWNAYQNLLNSLENSKNDIHAIGFGNDLSDTDMKNLAMFDNTAQDVGDIHVATGGFCAAIGVYVPENGTIEYDPVDINEIETDNTKQSYLAPYLVVPASR